MAATAVGSARTAIALVMLLLAAAPSAAVSLGELDAERTWMLGSLQIDGADAISRSDVTDAMTTHPRAWWAFWRNDPEFDPLALRADVDRVQAFYRRRGYYEATVRADASIREDERTVDATITIVEGIGVRVERVSVEVDGPPAPTHDATVAALPLRTDAVFEERNYETAAKALERAYREAGHARVVVRRHARVDLDTHRVTVTYTIVPGPSCVFGEVEVSGTTDVDPAIVRAEVAFHPGDPFRESALERTRTQLQATNLFSILRVEDVSGDGEVVDVRIHVGEAPPRDVRLGIGYDTDEGPRGTAAWRHFNFLGGGRQLGLTARGSQIELGAAIDFLQPHWPAPSERTRVQLAFQQFDEESYNLNRSSLIPRLEWQPRPELTAFVFARGEYDRLTEVEPAVQLALPRAAPRHSVLAGAGVGIDAIFADDPIDPHRGVACALTVDGAGLGGDVHLIRAVATAAVYHPLGFLELFGAARVRLGIVEPIAGDDEVPLFERLYAGGVNSVRGYERRHVGPLADGDPLGGRTLVETSVELRRVIVGDLGGAVFVDAGHVGLDVGDFRLSDVAVGAGFGVRYRSPVGPIRLDLGFPFDPPPGDQSWQVYVSIGRAF